MRCRGSNATCLAACCIQCLLRQRFQSAMTSVAAIGPSDSASPEAPECAATIAAPPRRFSPANNISAAQGTRPWRAAKTRTCLSNCGTASGPLGLLTPRYCDVYPSHDRGFGSLQLLLVLELPRLFAGTYWRAIKSLELCSHELPTALWT